MPRAAKRKGRVIPSRAMRGVALIAVIIAMAVVCSCGRTRTNTYEIEITGPTESERVRLLLDGREIAAVPGFEGKATVSLDEVTPFPNARPPGALKAEVFGPDGWTAAAATIGSHTSELVESELAKGVILPLHIVVFGSELSPPLRVYVDNLGRTQMAQIALGHAERRVAAGEAQLLEFLSPTKDEGMRLRVDGVEVGRVHLQKVAKPGEEIEQISWLVDVSGRHVYRRRVVIYQERVFSYSMQFEPDKGTTLQSAHLHEIPHYQIDYFLKSAPSGVMSQDLGVSRIELVDVK